MSDAVFEAGAVVGPIAEPTRRLRRPSLAALLVVAVIVGTFAAGRWLTSASAFDSGGEIGFDSLTYGEQYHLSLVPPGHIPNVTLKHITVELAPGSGDAATSVRACSTRIGAARGPLPCRARPVQGHDLGRLAPTDSLILTVVPLQDGPVTVDRVIFEFSDGLRTGRNVVGPSVTIGLPRRETHHA